MDEFAARRAPLEYWFLKLVDGDLAFLVDWIVRRPIGQATVRVSLWVRGSGRVLHSVSPTWSTQGGAVLIAGCAFTPARSEGAVEDVRWELSSDPGPSLLDPVPLPAKLLAPFDLRLAGRPRARFTGTVEVAGESFAVHEATGSLYHYWGRRLPDDWVWVSADGLGGGDALVEAALLRTRLWGRPGTSVTGGYCLVDDGRRSQLVVAPAYGRVHGHGDLERFRIRAESRRGPIELEGCAPAASYNDLGEGIRQTLLGDCEVSGLGRCQGRAGLEVRGRPFAAGRGAAP